MVVLALIVVRANLPLLEENRTFAAMAMIAERRMLGFAGELLRVRRTRPGVSDQRFGALRPAVLRLKALSRAKRFWRARAACNSRVRARCGRRGSLRSADELAGSNNA